MAKDIKSCKYCGSKCTSGGEICWRCKEKLPLVRQLLQMVRDAKERVEQERTQERIQNDLERVRGDG